MHGVRANIRAVEEREEIYKTSLHVHMYHILISVYSLDNMAIIRQAGGGARCAYFNWFCPPCIHAERNCSRQTDAIPEELCITTD